MITSNDNEKLKLVRKLRMRKWREREGVFATEGEDLLEAGRRAGAEPRLVLVAAGSGLGGLTVDPELLGEVSALGSGTRVIALWPLPDPTASAPATIPPPAVYLHGVSDPRNVGAILRSAAALGAKSLVLGADCADPYGPRSVRASMGAIFQLDPLRAPIADVPRPRVALVAHGGEAEPALDGAATLVVGAERGGIGAELAASCERSATIAIATEAVESLNVAAAAAIALHRISSAGDGVGGES